MCVTTRTPWAEWLRAGAFAFGLKPAEFWRLSLAEWRALAGAGGAPTADELVAMMRAHPDNGSQKSEIGNRNRHPSFDFRLPISEF